ncbi:MAG: sensor histidine kinase [Vulcanococcus sp.]
MQVSKRFLALLEQQLAQFTDRPDLRQLVVYLALPGENGKPNLVAIGQWPALGQRPSATLSAGSAASPAAGSPPAGDPPNEPESSAAVDHALTGGLPLGEGRRWLALRDGPLLLGALRVDASCWPWPMALSERLEATARCLTEALRLDLEQQRLGLALARRDDQLRLLVHQLRNPLAALRTFGQLLRRRLEGDSANRDLVDQLLAEQGQMTRYVEAIDQLATSSEPAAMAPGATPLLLPPGLGGSQPEELSTILAPLLERASATAALQGRAWRGPERIPGWRGDGAAVAEIVANLLENAFRYCVAGGAIGLEVTVPATGGIDLTVWDSGPAIPAEERERIFARGERGSTGRHRPGTGLGLALGRDLAHSLGGDLSLLATPEPAAAGNGNAFRLHLPA